MCHIPQVQWKMKVLALSQARVGSPCGVCWAYLVTSCRTVALGKLSIKEDITRTDLDTARARLIFQTSKHHNVHYSGDSHLNDFSHRMSVLVFGSLGTLFYAWFQYDAQPKKELLDSNVRFRALGNLLPRTPGNHILTNIGKACAENISNFVWSGDLQLT